jgi:hypothetical protein
MNTKHNNIEIANFIFDFDNICQKTIDKLNYIIILNKYDLEYYENTGCFNFYKNKLINTLNKYNVDIVSKELLNEYLNTHSNIVFLDNEIAENIVYKKYELNNKFYFFQIDKYNETIFDFRRKSYFQICEALGVKKIIYNVSESDSAEFKISGEINAQEKGINSSYNNNTSNSNNNNLISSYNKMFTKYISYEPHELENEIKSSSSHFLISESDFEHDYNLRCLIRSRLNGNLIDSNLEYKISNIDNNDLSLGLNIGPIGKLNSSYHNLKSKNYVLNMKVEFYPLEELISSDNIKYNPSYTIEKNKRLFQLLKLRLNLDLSKSNDWINEPFNYIENFFQDYIASKKLSSEIETNFKLLKIIDNTRYNKIITSIDSFHDIEDVISQLQYISLANYFCILDEKTNNNNLEKIKQILNAYELKQIMAKTNKITESINIYNSVEYKLLVDYVNFICFNLNKSINKNNDFIINILEMIKCSSNFNQLNSAIDNLIE